MSPGSDDVSSAIRALWERERGAMLRRVEAIDRAIAALGQGELGAETRADAEVAAHKIAGAAGTFGFPDASQNARAIELALRDGAGPADAAGLAKRASAIRADFEREPRA